jgi:hypothetical protein
MDGSVLLQPKYSQKPQLGSSHPIVNLSFIVSPSCLCMGAEWLTFRIRR